MPRSCWHVSRRTHVSAPLTFAACTASEACAAIPPPKANQPSTSQMNSPEGASHVVDWDNGRCTCLKFRDQGYPCRHALAMACHLGLSSHDKVSHVYSISSYRATYHLPHPPIIVDNPSHAERCSMPTTIHPCGRPRKSRIRRDRPSAWKYRCGNCGRKGHTRKSCANSSGKFIKKIVYFQKSVITL